MCLIIELQSTHNTFAADSTVFYQIGNAKTIKTLDEIIKLFEENSPNIKQIKLKYDSKIFEYEEAEESEKDYHELLSSSLVYSDYSTLSSIRKQYLAVLLERELLSFYSKNKHGLVSYEIQKEKYELISMYYQMIVLEKKYLFYKANEDYLSVCKSIADVKCRYGQCTELEVEQISAQIKENDTLLYETEIERMNLQAELEEILGIFVDFSVKIPITTQHISYELSDTTALLNKNEYSYDEALSCKDAYFTCNNCEETFFDSFTYKKYDVFIKQYTIYAAAIEKNISAYAKDMISSYNNYCKKVAVDRKILINYETSYKNICKRYKKGKASRLDVLDVDKKRAEAEYNYYSVIQDKLLCEYILSNGLYIPESE